MAIPATPLLRRVSRRELAQNRWVWFATGGVYLLFAVLTGGLIMLVGGLSPLRMQVMLGVFVVSAVLLLRSEPPPLGSLANHVVLALTWGVVGVAFWAYQPGGALAVGGMMFVGPLIAVRLQDRRQIAGHLAAANLLALLIGALGGIDHSAQIAIAVMVPASTVLCFSCVVILEAAEAQGDELERLVRRDPLTGVGNRRLLDERLEEELRRHERARRELTLVALDLNGFKIRNDTIGHAAGDELLRDVADALVRITGPDDTVVRQGGDEFCLILSETSAEDARATVSAIRAELSRLAVTAGVGLASAPTDATEAHVLLHVADERLRGDKPVDRPTRGSLGLVTGPPTARRVVR